MLVISLVMLVIVVLAGLVVTFVAFPHRGEQLPAAPWLGEAMARAAEAAPTLTTEGDPGHDPADNRTPGRTHHLAADPSGESVDSGRKH